jgi:cobalt-zinc-cadmium efflux system outer membrane protein
MIAAALLASMAVLTAPEPPLTEARAVELALRADPVLAALDHGVDERLALRDAAGRLENPELRVQNLRSDRLLEPAVTGTPSPPFPFERARVGLRWEPPALGERGARIAEAAAGAEAAAADRALHRRAVVARVRGLHATLLALDAELSLARAAEQEREQLRRVVARRVEAGAATVIEESAAELDVLEAHAAVEELELRRRRAHDGLTIDLGLAPGTALSLSGDGAARCVAPDAAATAAPQEDPRQRALRAELAATDAALTRRWLAVVPWITEVQVSYVVPGGEGSPAYWTLQLGLSLPLLDWRRAERRALVAARARIEDEGRARAVAVSRDVQRAGAERAEQAALARHHAAAAAALDGTLERFRRSAEPLAVLEAGRLRARRLLARRAQLEAELQCALRRIDLDRLAAAPAGAGGA